MVQIRKRTLSTPRQAAKVSRPIDKALDAELFKSLADPTRLRLLACIAKCGRACGVGEVAECCSVDLSVVSRHLAALERAGVLEATKEGRSVSYRVRFEEVVGMFRALADALEQCCPAACACDGGKECACGPGCC